MKFWRSLQTQLSICLAVVMMITAAVAGSFSFKTAFHEVIELQDDQLRQMSALAERRHTADSSAFPDLDNKVVDVGARIQIQVWSHGQWGGLEGATVALPIDPTLPDGLQSLVARGSEWRIFLRTTKDGERIAVSQPTDVRDEVAHNAAKTTIIPIAALIPVLVLIMLVLIRIMLHPVMRLARELDQRSDDQLDPLDDSHVASEILPFTAAINRLLNRVDQTLSEQRRFVADAAHELRTPLTAVSLQAESLTALPLDNEASQRVAILQRGILRARHLVAQLLLMARSQGRAVVHREEVQLASICLGVLEDQLPLADQKNISLTTDIDPLCFVSGHSTEVAAIIRNLIDNALRYTQAGGEVAIAVTLQTPQISIRVSDNGPGIPEQERQRVFDPFYRILGNDETGSGLGLAIVKTIVDRMGGAITLTETRHGSGLSVTIILPLSGCQQGMQTREQAHDKRPPTITKLVA